jgi:hypothetical protein
MSFDLKGWYAGNLDENVLYSYMGELDNSHVDEILNKVETLLFEHPKSPKVNKKVYNVLVECLQNSYHHGELPPGVLEGNGDSLGVLIIRNEGFHYRIITGNFIRVGGLKLIRDRIDQINTLTKEDTRALYKLILNNNQYSDKGGGGLGIVDIARKTGNNMEYQFFEHNEEFIFLALNVIIS